MKNPTIIFRTINACNLNCTYCYDKQNHYNIKKENENLEKNLPQIINNINKLLCDKECSSEFIFHGGEPLLIVPNIYRKFIEQVKKEHPKLRFSIQTNGTLISEEFIKVFKEYNISVGISLDGCNEKQNKYRVDYNGNNSFDNILKSIKLLKKNSIRFGIIMSLSKESVGYEKELYDFIGKNNLNCNIRPIFGNKKIMMSNDEYYNFFTKLFDIWLEDSNSNVSLKQITEIYEAFKQNMIPTYKPKLCSKTCNCFNNFISLDVEGNLYSCNRTYNNKNFYYGNMNEMTIEELRKKMERKATDRLKSVNNSKCINCKIYEICKGGCPSNGFMKHGSIYGIDDNYCKARIMINDYIYNRLQENGMIEEYKKRKEKYYE